MFGLLRGRLGGVTPAQVLLELAIVFVGVYLAFVFTEYQQDRERQRDADRVLALLEVGLERFEGIFERIAQYHERENPPFRAALAEGRIPDFGDQYYPAPQYPLDVIKFVTTRESFEVFPLQFYVSLTTFAATMQRLMYVEEALARASERWVALPPPEAPRFERVFAEQSQNARRYAEYLDKRGAIAAELAAQATELLADAKRLRGGKA